MPERPRLNSNPKGGAAESRLVPITVAGLVCFVTAVALGYGGWVLFGTHERDEPGRVADVRQSPAPPPTPEATPAAPPPSAPAATAPAGELPVPGGEVTLGGEGTGFPLKRAIVKPFLIAETETTNEQYRDFLKDTGHAAPSHWREGEFPPGAALEPVTGVTWQDAVDYCQWLSTKLGVTVRLPAEAEWELAARGPENLKYPWGNEWDERAAASEETGGRVRAVKSYPAGRSPFGAFDMVGNVWEWVEDEFTDKEGRPKSEDGAKLRVIRGGAATEPRAYVSAAARYGVREDIGSPRLGFRYVVVRP
ncbi:MAG TPA: SUMF1/EgtB/PvdO family nonheme iron enzyme [Pyrinomonadaceae bacterium]|jgi:formylglycine-generating enzyme required for sulfatase activity|nr:SUMF1/EgtB/PvdO family nonheme iron enzyme [Pyrinomonadaceae bacterium]